MQLIRAHSNWCQASDGSPLTPRPAFPARMICHSPSLRSSLLPRSPHPSHQSDSLSLSLLISKPKDYMPTLKHFSTKTLCSTDPWLWKWTNLGINETSSFHWLSSSIFTYCLFVCPASVTPPLISTIWCFRPNKPYIFCEDIILATCQCHILSYIPSSFASFA